MHSLDKNYALKKVNKVSVVSNLISKRGKESHVNYPFGEVLLISYRKVAA